MQLKNAYHEFMLDQKARGNTRKTLIAYEAILQRFLAFAGEDTETTDVGLNLCRAYYGELSKTVPTSTSVQSYIRHVRAFLRWMYDNEIMTEDVCKKFKLPKAVRPSIDVLTDEEVQQIFAAVRGEDFLSVRNELIVALFLDSGLRLNELVSIRRNRLHVDERYVIVDGKGNKQRAVPFGNGTRALFRKYLNIFPGQSAFLFVREDGVHITENTVRDLFRHLKEASGIERLHPHLLRHTFATRFLENGANIYALQSILGHTTLEMVRRYLHLSDRGKIREEFVNYSPFDSFYAKK